MSVYAEVVQYPNEASSRRTSRSPIRWLVVLAALLLPTSSVAQVACDTPDDLCTGDPCEIGTVIVDDSCVVDFGSRTVVIDGRLRMPNTGVLSITAGTIEIDGGRIENLRSSGPPSTGPDITLAASGDIRFPRGKISLRGIRGEAVPGSVVIDAGGRLEMRGGLSAHTSPTSIVLRSGSDDIEFQGRVRAIKEGGQIEFDSGGGIEIRGSIHRFEDIVMTAAGNVDFLRRNTPRETLTVDAGGVVTLATPIRRDGAIIRLRGDAGVVVEKSVKLVPLFIFEGIAEFTSANGPVTINSPVHAVDLDVTAGGDVNITATLSARPPTRSGGTIDIESTGGNVFVDGWLRAQSGDGVAPGDGAGGQIRIEAAQSVFVTEDISVNGFPGKEDAPGGTLEITAESISIDDVRLDADGGIPGPDFPGAPPAGFDLTSTVGDITMDGIFEARGGPSVVQATSAADLIASGTFLVAPLGCIGLDAVGTVDSTGASFDTPPVAVCP